MQRFFQPFSTQGREIPLEELLNAREARALLQQKLLAQYGQTLLSVTLTAVGGVKKNALLDYVFEKALEKLTALFARLAISPSAEMIRPLESGHEAFFVLDIKAHTLKQTLIALEDSTPLARLWDLDVFDAQGQLLSRAQFGLPPRDCLVCGNEAKSCARSRVHSPAEITAQMQQRAINHYFAEKIGELAYQALLEEAQLSPKPGLVDAINNGAHRDMNLGTFKQSAAALKPFLTEFVLKGIATASQPESAILGQIRPLGVQAEQAMFTATCRVNTHKGAIFSFGLVCTAVGRIWAQAENKSAVDFQVNQIGGIVAQFAQGLTAELAHSPAHLPLTAGVRLYREYGLTGARGEAESGLTQIQMLWPFLEKLDSLDWTHRLYIALLHLMAHNPDTNIVNRGGLEGLAFVQQRAIDLLKNQSVVLDKALLIQHLTQFDAACIERNLSPGGSADLLAITIFFLFLRGL